MSVALIVPTLAAGPFRLRPFALADIDVVREASADPLIPPRHRGGQEGEPTVPPVIREQVNYGRDV